MKPYGAGPAPAPSKNKVRFWDFGKKCFNKKFTIHSYIKVEKFTKLGAPPTHHAPFINYGIFSNHLTTKNLQKINN